MKAVETWLFDLDNVLYPPKANMLAHIAEVFVAYVAQTTGLSVEEVAARHKRFAEHYGDAVRGWIEEEKFDLKAWQRDQAALLDYTKVSPCAATVLKLQQLPGRKIVFTNGHAAYAENMLARLNMHTVFEAVSSVTSRGTLIKPQPESYCYVLEHYGLNAATTALVEDSHRNLQPAKTLGLTTVLVNAAPVNAAYVDYYYPTLDDFLQAVLPVASSAEKAQVPLE